MNNQPSALSYDRLRGAIGPGEDVAAPDPLVTFERTAPALLSPDGQPVSATGAGLSVFDDTQSMRRPEGLSERSTRWSSRGEHFWFEPEGLQAADFFARSELAPESGKDKERLLGRNGREEFGVEGFDTLIENRARGPRYYQRPTLSGDQRIFSDLAAYALG